MNVLRKSIFVLLSLVILGFIKFHKNERGTVSGEYVLILAVIGAGLAAAFAVGESVTDALENAAIILGE